MSRFGQAVGMCVALLLVGSGCITANYHVVEPIKPKPVRGYWSPVVEVESVQPTLEWKPADASGVSYDLIVYSAVVTPGAAGGLETVCERGKEAYYREALPAASHKIEVPLQPGKLYFWSVRTRAASGVSAWATWDRRKLFGGEDNIWWMFQTPQAAS